MATRLLLQTRGGIVVLILTAGVLLAAVIAALRPLPPRHLALATGPPGSAYARAGEQYRSILARQGVQLRLVPTNGAVEDARLLRDAHAGVAAGFVQSGSLEPGDDQELESLGTVFYEAVWLFCRCSGPATAMSERVGWRVSIGPPGSADRPLALKLLALNGVNPGTYRLFDYPPEQAAAALADSQLDAVLILSGWDSPVIQQLARAPGITLLGFARADAYVALDPALSKLVLPRGVADLANNRPAEDTTLIASKASLAVRRDLHPALQYLLLQTAMQIHSRPGMFHRAGEFPAAEGIDLPLSDEARQIYRAGPSFLQRTLPFWLAELVQRLLILILPIAGIVYPLWSLAPRIYSWQKRRRIYRMYGELRLVALELKMADPATGHRLLKWLDEIDARVLAMNLPAAFGEPIFNLRAHISSLRERVRDIRTPS